MPKERWAPRSGHGGARVGRWRGMGPQGFGGRGVALALCGEERRQGPDTRRVGSGGGSTARWRGAQPRSERVQRARSGSGRPMDECVAGGPTPILTSESEQESGAVVRLISASLWEDLPTGHIKGRG